MNSIAEDDEEILSMMASSTSVFTSPQDDSGKEEENEKEIEPKERPTRSNVTNSKTRSHSSSPSTQNRSRRLIRHSSSVPRLRKTMSCRTLWELEEEEVKGFLDLGFTFDTQNLCPRMMSVVPGLQRLGSCKNVSEKDDEIEKENDHEGLVLRPYLSEAWLIKTPDSPLLNLKIPKVSTVADMKKHLKYWARTVAYEIQQES